MQEKRHSALGTGRVKRKKKRAGIKKAFPPSPVGDPARKGKEGSEERKVFAFEKKGSLPAT